MASTTDRGAPSTTRARLGPLVNTFIVAGGYLLSRVLGLIRDVIISARFGTSAEMDAYRAAFGVLDLVYLVIAGGALGSAFIPIFTQFLTHKQEEDAWNLASNMLNLVLLALVVVCTLLALLAQPIVALTVVRGLDPTTQALTANIMRLLLIQPILLGVGGLAKATLESFDRFTLPAIGSNLYNIGIIVGALILAQWFGIYGLAWGVIIGAALFLLIQMPGLRSVGMRYRPLLHLKTPGVRRVGQLLGPRLFGQSAWQINLLATTSFASLVGEGAISANGYAFQLMLLPHGLIALSLGTVIFPQLTRHYAADDLVSFRSVSLNALRNVLFLALPAAMLLGVLRVPIVRMLFQRGTFNTESVTLAASALTFYALGLASFAAAEIVVRTFYAMQDTRTPVVVGIATVVVNIMLAWLLLPFGLGGLALAFSAAATLETTTLLVLLRRRLGTFGSDFWRALGSMVLATAALGSTLLILLWLSASKLPFVQSGATYRWPADFIPLVLWLSVTGGIGGAVYGGVATLLGLTEIKTTLGRLMKVVGKIRRQG